MNYKFEGTPGPWGAYGTEVRTKEDILRIFKESLDAHEGDLGDYFMEVCSGTSHRVAFIAGPTGLINAHLIAAAPELFEALKNVMPAVEFFFENFPPPAGCESKHALMLAHAALKKALGHD